MAAHTLADDEAFARMLQQQEDERISGRYSRTRVGADPAEQLTQSFAQLDVEEPRMRAGMKPPPNSGTSALRRSRSMVDDAQQTSAGADLSMRRDSRVHEAARMNAASPGPMGDGIQDYVRIRADPQATTHLHNATIEEHLKFARQLQEKALANITVDTNDAELARRMQELEEQGLGRMNSDRRMMEPTDVTKSDPAPALAPKRTPPSDVKRLTADEKIARYLQSTGKSFSALTDDVLETIMQDKEEHVKPPPPANVPEEVIMPGPPHRSSTLSTISAASLALPVASSLAPSVTTSLVPPVASSLTPSVSAPHHRSVSPAPPVSSPHRLSVSPVPPVSSPHRLSVSPAPPVSAPHRLSVSKAFPNPDQVSVSRSPSLLPGRRGISPEPPKIRSYRAARPENQARSAPTTPTRERKLRSDDTGMSSFEEFLGAIDAAGEPASKEKEKKKKKKRIFLGFVGKNNQAAQSPSAPPLPETEASQTSRAKAAEVVELRPPPRTKSPVPGGLRRHSSPKTKLQPHAPNEPEATSSGGRKWFGRPKSPAGSRNARSSIIKRNVTVCAKCGKTNGNFLAAMDKKFHADCFRCHSCNEKIDPAGEFKISEEADGKKLPHHVKCYSEMFGIRCAVCKNPIPASKDGSVTFVKHPFFDTEHMCLSHAENPGRRCSGCQRFEPEDEPFIDLHDSGRCLCYACCRSVVVDKDEAKPLWEQVLRFFEDSLKVTVWPQMKRIPILVVGTESLNDQIKRKGHVHGSAQQLLTAGLCLTDNEEGRRFKLSSMKFDKSTSSFRSLDKEDRGYTYYELRNERRNNTKVNVSAILCLTGLPRDLTASILAHEATHAWFKLHPDYSEEMPLPPQLEEGCAQLVAMLFLSEGLEPADATNNFKGPSDDKLRQYFKFSIERTDNEIYGVGYRRASRAYRDIGIEALLNYAVQYREFPQT